jgi:protein TonB
MDNVPPFRNLEPSSGAESLFAQSDPSMPTFASKAAKFLAASAGANGSGEMLGASLGAGENPPPKYPSEALRQRIEGQVVLRVAVACDGKVKRVDIAESSGHQSLDDAALRAVEQWRLHPALLAGSPVESEVRLPIKFVLKA